MAQLQSIRRSGPCRELGYVIDDLSRRACEGYNAAAQRAVDPAATNALSHYALATVHYFRKDKVAFRTTKEKCLALNPLDGSAIAYLGALIATTGEWERGCSMVEPAMKLNPSYPSWFQIAMWANAYRQGKYEAALEANARVNLPGIFHAPAPALQPWATLVKKEAQKALQDLLALRPDFAFVAQQEHAK